MNPKKIITGIVAGISLVCASGGWANDSPSPLLPKVEVNKYPLKKSSADLPKIIDDYRKGDVDAGNELLQRFKPFLKKYWCCLWLGKIPDYDPDMFRFLSFFHKDRKTAAELLAKSIRRNDVEDLNQVLSVTLLKTALRYNVISVGFKYVLKKEISDLTKDLSTHRTTQHWGLWNGKGNNGGLEPHTTPLTAAVQDSESISEFLLEGSEIEGFKDLVYKERLLVKLAYIDEFTNEKIAGEMGMTLRQVRRMRQKIREKLGDSLFKPLTVTTNSC